MIPSKRIGRVKPPKGSYAADQKLLNQMFKKLRMSTRYKRVGPVIIGCMDEDARDLLETIMDEWKKRKKGYPKGYRPSTYGFAYWLVRWSGLIKDARRKNR